MKKRVLSILLCTVLMLGAIFGASVTTDAAQVYGDVDGNGALDIIDATRIQRHLAGWKTLDEAAQQRGMVSGSDTLSLIDATLIQRRIAQMIDRFPIEPPEDIVPIYFTDSKNWGTIYAYLFDYETSEAPVEWPGVKMTDVSVTADGDNEYRLDVDVSRYDRVIFNDGNKKKSIDTPVTKASFGYQITDKNKSRYNVGIYTSEQYGTGTLEIVKMDYPGYAEGEKKTVWIYLPEGYDSADTSKQYAVLYMSDGQIMLGDRMPGDDWKCDCTVRSLMQNGYDGVILVGVSSLEGERFEELYPYIENPDFLENIYQAYLNGWITEKEMYEEIEWQKEYKKGDVFADFMVNDVIPYVESRYNVSSVRGYMGASLGGLEGIYIAMEYPETFDFVGMMSPAFAHYSEYEWKEYLKKKDFSGTVPRLYIFCGNNPKDEYEPWFYPYASSMEEWLIENGYPDDRITTVLNEDTKHHAIHWSLYFPEVLCQWLEL